jgi:uncharacterized repeat protein (TIGR03803 family)
MLGRLLLAAGLLLSGAANAAEYTQLHAFTVKNGLPNSALLRDASGNLYGTAATDPGIAGNIGTVFKIAPDGSETILYRFKGHLDGRFPHGPLIADPQGNLYGVTEEGGGKGELCVVPHSKGCGTVFKLAPDGTKTVLHAFSGGHDGALPQAGVIADAAGNLYGTTGDGGGCAQYRGGCGTVYKLAPNGHIAILHAFSHADGSFPTGRLTMDAAGNLYGTTMTGGGEPDAGTVFKIASDGTFSVLYVFQGEDDGVQPASELLVDNAGNLYGTTWEGGGHCHETGCGTVFKLAPDGTKITLHHFGGSDGATPIGGLIADAQGNLYGTTETGPFLCWHGPCGRIFKIAPDGTYSVLYKAHKNGAGGFTASLIMDADGILYGASRYGGAHGKGTVFKLVP